MARPVYLFLQTQDLCWFSYYPIRLFSFFSARGMSEILGGSVRILSITIVFVCSTMLILFDVLVCSICSKYFV